MIEGAETFNGKEVPKRVQVENTEEYFCTLVDPVYGVSEWIAQGVGIVKSSAKVTIYGPGGEDPFIAGADDELRKAVLNGKSYP